MCTVLMFCIYSDCDTEWQDCIEEDERYLVDKLHFYRNNSLSDRCIQEQVECSISAYPGCDSESQSYDYIRGYGSYGHQRFPRQTNTCGKCGCSGECDVQNGRVLRNDNGVPIKYRQERIMDRIKTLLPQVNELMQMEKDKDVP